MAQNPQLITYTEKIWNEVKNKEYSTPANLSKILNIPFITISDFNASEFSPYVSYNKISIGIKTNLLEIDTGKLVSIFAVKKLWLFIFVMSNKKNLILKLSIFNAGFGKEMMNKLSDLFLKKNNKNGKKTTT